jgi:glycosyltransferase involved in cell wall biosynthesis
MRILYDGLIYATQTAGGINRYFANLVSRLPSDSSAVLTTPRVGSVNFPAHRNLDVHVPRVVRPRQLGLATRPLQLRGAERHFGHDLVHPTYYMLQTLRPIRRVRKPVVVTAYDLTHEFFPDELGRRGLIARLMRTAVRDADVVLCISENTRRDLVERYPVDESKLRVVPLATDLGPHLVSDAVEVPQQPYVLYVGSRARYKDFDLALQAVAALDAAHADLRLVVVGAPLTSAEHARIAELGIAGRVVEAGTTDDVRLATLYARSRALVYPSRYEGFGIPPLEAMACGTVAIASNVSSIPEVVGDAALLHEPGALDELVEHVRTVLEDDATRDDLIARGRERAATFSWDRTASETFAAYREVVG